MNIDSLTVAEVREITALLNNAAKKDHPYQIGATYFVRTVVFHYTGKLEAVTDTELVLTDCAWIADDGRFQQAVATGEFSEVEPYPDGEVIIGRGAIVDACQVSFAPPRSQK